MLLARIKHKERIQIATTQSVFIVTFLPSYQDSPLHTVFFKSYIFKITALFNQFVQSRKEHRPESKNKK